MSETNLSEASTEIKWSANYDFPSSTFLTSPKPVGWWIMPGSYERFKTKFKAYKKPNALVRFSMKHVFGWTWEDANV